MHRDVDESTAEESGPRASGKEASSQNADFCCLSHCSLTFGHDNPSRLTTKALVDKEETHSSGEQSRQSRNRPKCNLITITYFTPICITKTVVIHLEKKDPRHTFWTRSTQNNSIDPEVKSKNYRTYRTLIMSFMWKFTSWVALRESSYLPGVWLCVSMPTWKTHFSSCLGLGWTEAQRPVAILLQSEQYIQSC